MVVRIYGNEINKRYTDLLKTNDTLSLWDCISLDAVQKGRTIHENIAQDLLKRGLIEGEAPHYSISLSIAKNTHQLPSYTKTKGLDKERLRQMTLQYLSNAGDEGAKRDSIYEYLKDVLPQNNTEEQQLRYVGRLLVELNEEKVASARLNVGVTKDGNICAMQKGGISPLTKEDIFYCVDKAVSKTKELVEYL